jgi:hypothetical protein
VDGLRDRFLNVSLLPGSQAHADPDRTLVNIMLPRGAVPVARAMGHRGGRSGAP